MNFIIGFALGMAVSAIGICIKVELRLDAIEKRLDTLRDGKY